MKDIFFRRATRKANKPVTAEVGAEFTDGSTVEFAVRHLFGAMNSRVQIANGMEGDRLSALLSHPAVWVPSAVGIVREEEYRTPARRTSLINAGRHHEVLRNLLVELRKEHADRYEALQEVLKERFDASLDDVQFDEVTDEYVKANMTGEGGAQHDLYSAGSGLIQTVQLLAFILVQTPSVVLLDEPDAHLHSSLQRGIIEILEHIGRNEEFQIIVATHSKEIINFIDPTRLIFVQPGEVKAGPMGQEVTPIAVLRSLGAIDNVDAFALLKNRRCLFVEGTSDVAILERLAATLGLHMFGGDDRVVVIPTGGADQFGHVQQLDVFEQLLGSTLASLELRDRDSRIDDDRTDLVAKAQRPLRVFELDSIESYLLNPEVIARVICDVATERGKDVDVEAGKIEEVLLALTDDLKLNTIDRAAERYGDYHRRTTGKPLSIQHINQAAREFVEENWGSLQERLLVVSGKKLLSSLRSTIQDVYKVNFGNERLADGFTLEEIPAELVEALQATADLAVSDATGEGVGD